jgi:predicted transposase YdaD
MGIKEQVLQIAEEVGKAKGKAETHASAIPYMHNIGISITDIAKAFKITEKEVQKILNSSVAEH